MDVVVVVGFKKEMKVEFEIFVGKGRLREAYGFFV